MSRLLLPVSAALALVGCTSETPCAPGFTRDAAGYCLPDDDGSDGGSGGGGSGDTDTPADDTAAGGDDTGGGGDDTGETPITWQTLPEGCTAPDETGEDPVWKQGEYFVQANVFAELVDVEVDESRGQLWGVGQGGVMALDVSDPFNPSFISAVSPFDWFQRAYKLHLGPYPTLYATHRDYGLVAYDRTDAENPVEHTIVNATNLSGLTSADGYLYVATFGGALITYDIATDPLSPAQVALTTGLASGFEPVVWEDHIYVADNTLGVVVLDRSNPAEPSLVGSFDTAGGAQDLALSGDASVLYVAVGGAGVEVFDLSDPASPVSLGVIDLNYSAINVAVGGNMLWAVTQQDVVAIDISTPDAPVLVNTDETTQWAMTVTASQYRAYVGDWAWLAIYQADADKRAPDAEPASGLVHVDPGGDTVRVRLANLGNAPLSLLGATVSDDAVTVEAESLTVPAGDEIQLRVTSTGTAVDGIICLATDDPDEPRHELRVTTGGVGGSALGLPAPDFSLQGLDGQTYVLSEQIGHPVVLAYFATW